MDDSPQYWRGFIVVASVVFLGAIVAGWLLRDSNYGNVASIVGLAVSILGFAITIWTILDAKKQIRDASERAENETALARTETRQSVKAIAAQLLGADCATLRHGVEDLRQAAQDTQWRRASFRCQECRRLAYRLAHDPNIAEDEASRFRAGADDFKLILRFIEKNRLEGQTGFLKDIHLQNLDEMIGLLAQVEARLHQEPLRLDASPLA